MLYTPIKTADYLPNENFNQLYAEVIKKLDACKESGYMPSFDNLKIYYEYFLCEGAKENIVIVHGLSEFTKKFYELAYFFLNNRFNVFIIDLRGHGYSEREDDAGNDLHVKDFFSYVKDLHVFIENVVKKASSLPINFFSQSMGGAIAGLYLQEHSQNVKKAIFSAPMVCPNFRNAPRLLVRMVARRKIRKFGGAKTFFKSKPFNPNADFDTSSDLSYDRFLYNLTFRINDKRYQSGELSNCWMEQATFVQGLMLRKKKCQAVETECLIISAGKDNVVLEKPQRKFAKRLKNGKFISIPFAKHNIFSGDECVLQEMYSIIKQFFNIEN